MSILETPPPPTSTPTTPRPTPTPPADRVLELGAVVLLGGLAVTVAPDVGAQISFLAVAAVTPALVRHDLAVRRLPNPLVGLLATAFVVGSTLRGVDSGLLSASIPFGWAALWFAVAFALAVGGAFGMGDVKLGAALVGIAAPWGGIAVGALVAGAGVIGLIVVAATALRARGSRSRGVPFGPCLLASFWALSVFGGPLL